MVTKRAAPAPASKWPEKLDKRLWPKVDKKRLWPLDKIVPYHRNPRTHPPAQITLLAQLIRKYGPDQDIIVDEDRIILKGHGRRLAAYEGELTEFPVLQRFGLSEDEKRAMRIADNQVALLSGWDNELVKGEIVHLKDQGYPIALLGFGEAQLVQFTTMPSPPGEFATYDENISTQFCCPSCKYAWSGDPLAGKVKDGKPGVGDADSVQMRVPRKANSERRPGTATTVRGGASVARKKPAGKGKPGKHKKADGPPPGAKAQ